MILTYEQGQFKKRKREIEEGEGDGEEEGGREGRLNWGAGLAGLRGESGARPMSVAPLLGRSCGRSVCACVGCGVCVCVCGV